MKCAYTGCEAVVGRKSSRALYCSDKCKWLAWSQSHPRKPEGTVIVPQGSRIVPPDALEGFQALSDVVGRGSFGVTPIVAQGGANAVSDVPAKFAAVDAKQAATDARLAAIEAKPIGRRSGTDPILWKHGANCYRNHGCKCRVCLDGHAEKVRRARKPRVVVVAAVLEPLLSQPLIP